MKGFPVRPVPVENVGVAAKAVARRQAEQLTVVRRRAQPTAVYIARLTATAVFAYLIAQALPGGSPRSVLAPLTALLVVQATLFNTIGTAIRRVAAVTVGVLAAVAVAAYVPFSWWVLGLLVAGTLAIGIVLRLREEILEVPISAMLIFSVGSQAAASTRITETLVGAAAGLAAGLVFAPVRVQPAKEAVGELSRQMADLLGQMAEGLAETPDPKRAAEWLDRTRALRGEIERVDDALSQAEESVRLITLLLVGSAFPIALSVGLGWTTIEIVYTIVNNLAIAWLLQRPDERARRSLALLLSMGLGNMLSPTAPALSVIERIGVSALHIGFTLLIAWQPLLVLVTIPLHSGANFVSLRLLRRSAVLSAVVWVLIGAAILLAGLAVWGML
jgi:gas vesicle protein